MVLDEANRQLAVAFGFVSAMLYSVAAFAVDGVVLIDQNRALAGGVTAGDAPGFPITISQPGTYRLSGNLNVPSGQSGFDVTVSHVTIDLNGFGITTPVQGGGSARGINFSGTERATFITIRNGSIDGFSSSMTFLVPIGGGQGVSCQSCTFEDLLLRWGLPGASSSLDLSNYIRIHRITAPDSNINVKCPTVVTQTVARSISVVPSIVDPTPSVGSCAFADNAVLQ